MAGASRSCAIRPHAAAHTTNFSADSVLRRVRHRTGQLHDDQLRSPRLLADFDGRGRRARADDQRGADDGQHHDPPGRRRGGPAQRQGQGPERLQSRTRRSSSPPPAIRPASRPATVRPTRWWAWRPPPRRCSASPWSGTWSWCKGSGTFPNLGLDLKGQLHLLLQGSTAINPQHGDLRRAARHPDRPFPAHLHEPARHCWAPRGICASRRYPCSTRTSPATTAPAPQWTRPPRWTAVAAPGRGNLGKASARRPRSTRRAPRGRVQEEAQEEVLQEEEAQEAPEVAPARAASPSRTAGRRQQRRSLR